MALSKEQFNTLRGRGLSVEQIVAFESGKRPTLIKDKFPQVRDVSIKENDPTFGGVIDPKANTALGFAKNFGKAFVGTLANAEVQLGKTISKLGGPNKQDLAANEALRETNRNLYKIILDKQRQGIDTTKLKEAYNANVTEIQKGEKRLGQYNASLPTTMQAAGQLGGTALDVLTAGTYSKAARALPTGKLGSVGTSVGRSVVGAAVPELNPIARQTAGGFLSLKGALKGAGNIAAGTGIGYASDVTQGLIGARGEDREGAKAFIPGAGTAIGFTLPVVSEATQTIKNIRHPEARIAEKRLTAIDDLQKRYKKVDTAIKAGDAKGAEVKRILTETDLLNDAVDKDGLVKTQKALENFNEMISPYEGQVRSALEKEKRRVNINEIAKQADDFIQNTRLKGAANERLQNEIIADIKNVAQGGNVNLLDIHDLKVQRGSANNYLDSDANAISKEVARFYKELVETNTNAIDVKNYNAELSKLYSVREVLEKLDGVRIKGGRLGKYFAQTIGGVAGSQFGPLGVIAGAELGNITQGSALERALGGNINKALKPSQKLLDALGTAKKGKDAIPSVVIPKKTPEIPDVQIQSSSKSGSLNSTQRINTPQAIAPNKNAISTTLPINGKKSNELSQAYAGAVVGVEEDEDGNITFSPEKALMGMVGMTAAQKLKVQKQTSKELYARYIKTLDKVAKRQIYKAFQASTNMEKELQKEASKLTK